MPKFKVVLYLIYVTRSAKKGSNSLSKYPILINHNSWSFKAIITPTFSPLSIVRVCCCQILGLDFIHKSSYALPNICSWKGYETPLHTPGHIFYISTSNYRHSLRCYLLTDINVEVHNIISCRNTINNTVYP